MGGTDTPNPPAAEAPQAIPPRAPESPQDAAKAVEADSAIDARRNEYKQAVQVLNQRLTDMISDNKTLEPLQKQAALADVTSFIGKLSAQMDIYRSGQQAKFKVSQRIGNLFNVEVGQDYLVAAAPDSISPEAKPFKLRLRVAVVPLGVTVGNEQFNDPDKAMGFADKSRQYLEIKVYEDGSTGVKLNLSQTVDSAKREGQTTYSGAVSWNAGDISGQTEIILPPGQGLAAPTVRSLLAGTITSGELGQIQGGGFVQMQVPTRGDDQKPRDFTAGVGVMGTF